MQRGATHGASLILIRHEVERRILICRARRRRSSLPSSPSICTLSVTRRHDLQTATATAARMEPIPHKCRPSFCICHWEKRAYRYRLMPHPHPKKTGGLLLHGAECKYDGFHSQPCPERERRSGPARGSWRALIHRCHLSYKHSPRPLPWNPLPTRTDRADYRQSRFRSNGMPILAFLDYLAWQRRRRPATSSRECWRPD